MFCRNCGKELNKDSKFCPDCGFIRQNLVKHYSSSSNFVVWARDVLGTENIEYTGGLHL